MDIEALKKRFHQLFGDSPHETHIFFAPGRINLIGEHTDYNNGLVLPCAITYGTYLLIRKTDSTTVNFQSENFDYGDEISLSSIGDQQPGKWMNYPLGIFDQMIRMGLKPDGMEMLYAGNIPNSAGLSSSASIEMVTAFALNEMYGTGLSMVDLVKLSQKAENEFVGVDCGIMDQFTVGMGKAGHALFLDCGTLEHELVPLNPGNFKILIINTRKERSLAESKYNERVKECQMAVQQLSGAKKIASLSELSYPEFTGIKHHVPDITIRKRAKHVISENQRVLDAVTMLRKNNLRVFGKLLNASHNSLRYDYEVTGYELDLVVDAARRQEGVLGARMTGAGFGGCAIALVEENYVKQFTEKVGNTYRQSTGTEPEFYVSEAGDGTKKIESY